MNEELSVEEIKRMRLCKCGNWKKSNQPDCIDCWFMTGKPEAYCEKTHISLIEGIKNAQETGDYARLVDGTSGERRMSIMSHLLKLRVLLSEADYKEAASWMRVKRIAKHHRIQSERRFISGVLNKENPTQCIGSGFSHEGNYARRTLHHK